MYNYFPFRKTRTKMRVGKLRISTLLALVSLWALIGSSDGTVEDQIGPLASELWKKVANGWLFIVSGDLNEFFFRYINIDRELFNLLEFEFTTGEQNWIIDFQDLDMTESYSKAYYRLLDVYEGTIGSFLRMLTIEDMDKIVDICEKHSQSFDTGRLLEYQFVNGMKEVVFRGVGTALLFVTYMTDGEIFYILDYITPADFSKMVEAMDIDSNGDITEQEMGQFWTEGNYGNFSTGETLFRQLDYNGDGKILTSEMDELFVELDCRGVGNGFVDFREFMQLDLIMRDLRAYPGGECILDYTQLL